MVMMVILLHCPVEMRHWEISNTRLDAKTWPLILTTVYVCPEDLWSAPCLSLSSSPSVTSIGVTQQKFLVRLQGKNKLDIFGKFKQSE